MRPVYGDWPTNKPDIWQASEKTTLRFTPQLAFGIDMNNRLILGARLQQALNEGLELQLILVGEDEKTFDRIRRHDWKPSTWRATRSGG